MRTQASIKNLAEAKPAAGLMEDDSYGLQFINLEPAYRTLLQSMTHEALPADRGSIA